MQSLFWRGPAFSMRVNGNCFPLPIPAQAPVYPIPRQAKKRNVLLFKTFSLAPGPKN